jgi:hypothetical protein
MLKAVNNEEVAQVGKHLISISEDLGFYLSTTKKLNGCY